MGVIGGLGPIATAYFYELVIQMTNAKYDQEHLEMLIFSKPSIPDRTEYILGRSMDSPAPAMIEIGRALAEMGAQYIAIPCITAHYFHDILSREIPVPIIHIVRETVEYIKSRGISRTGILATEGTVYSRLFQEELLRNGIQAVIPDQESQKKVTSLIYDNVKANQPVEINKFRSVSGELRDKGAEVIILACTELSLIKRDYDIGPDYLDAMEVLAMRAVTLCGAGLKEEYHSLIKK